MKRKLIELEFYRDYVRVCINASHWSFSIKIDLEIKPNPYMEYKNKKWHFYQKVRFSWLWVGFELINSARGCKWSSGVRGSSFLIKTMPWGL